MRKFWRRAPKRSTGLSKGAAGIVVMPVAAALTRTHQPQYYRQLTAVAAPA